MMFLILFLLLLAQANGLTIPSGCWVVFAVGCAWAVFAEIIKSLAERK